MTPGDWVAVLLPMTVAIFAAIFAAVSAGAATRQASEAERARQAAENQADSARIQAEEARKSRETSDRALQVALKQLEDTRERNEKADRDEVYDILSKLGVEILAVNNICARLSVMMRQPANNAQLELGSMLFDRVSSIMLHSASFDRVKHRVKIADDPNRTLDDVLSKFASDSAQTFTSENLTTLSAGLVPVAGRIFKVLRKREQLNVVD